MNKKLIVLFLVTLSCATQATLAALGHFLHLAAFYGNAELLQTLVNKQIYNIDAPDENGLTPLHYAAFKGYTKCVQILLSNKAYVHALGQSESTPLHYAAHNGHIDCVKALIQYGVAVDLQDAKLWTPLHHAAHWGHLECVQYLVEHGNANIYAKTKKGKTPIDVAREIFKPTRLAKIKTIHYLETIEQVRQQTQELMNIDIN
ncbi:ankyrin repeat domain-containing protein [bacterium]|nr:MAG: ankyrin repeat domain-containing protein [bacterium]